MWHNLQKVSKSMDVFRHFNQYLRITKWQFISKERFRKNNYDRNVQNKIFIDIKMQVNVWMPLSSDTFKYKIFLTAFPLISSRLSSFISVTWNQTWENINPLHWTVNKPGQRSTDKTKYNFFSIDGISHSKIQLWGSKIMLKAQL